jgi:tryptophanyl-tRNA synthetase
MHSTDPHHCGPLMDEAKQQATMVSETPEPSGVAAATADATTTSAIISDQKEETKKKSRVVNVPVCPAAVATAVLILRAAAAAVTGSDVRQIGTSLLQNTYVKENVLSGKFSIHYGKRLGEWCQLELPETADAAIDLLRTIETVANRLIAEQHVISCIRTTKAVVVVRYGHGVLDGSHQKTKVDEAVTLAIVGHNDPQLLPFVAVTVGPHVFASTGGLSKIELDLKECKVTAGRKAKKAEIMFKFLAVESASSEHNSLVVAEIQTDESLLLATLPEATIRAPEGLEYQAAQMAANTIAPDHSAEPEMVAPIAATTTVAATTLAVGPPQQTQQQQQQPGDDDDEMVVNIEEVKGKIDYDKLVHQFGSTIIDPSLLVKLERIAAARGGRTANSGDMTKLHRFLRRNIFFSHRDLHTLLDAVLAGTPVYLYTGRGPSSSSMHLGHLIPFLFTKWLQDTFDAPLVIQMTDDEKFIFKGVYEEDVGDNLDYFAQLTIENAKDIIACGFDVKKTFLFSDLDYVGTMYPNIVRIWKAVTTNAVTHIFGFDGSANIGKIAFPAVQAAPSFASSFPTVLQANKQSDYLCLIPCAIDQDPYFRMTRDISHKMMHKGHKLGGKPALIHSKFFPPLQGAMGKMSSSDTNSAIFLTDTPQEIERKIKNHAFSGGQDTKEKQQALGADLEVDVSYQWLRFFLEDDEELEAIGKSYGSGQGDYWSTSSVKARLIQLLQEIVAEHQARRATITDEEVRIWMQERSIV